MGPLGWPEMIFIFVLALVLFGPKKLPEIGRTIGKAMGEFRRASNELKSTFEREMQGLEKETEPLRQITNSFQSDTYNYDYAAAENTYEGSYGSEYNSTPATPVNLSASAPEGAELPPVVAPEGTVAHGEPEAVLGPAGSLGEAPAAAEHTAPASTKSGQDA
ncbi:MAG: twin-arginine translocase TatA/TatE family subunit [Acidobacteriia bacterium]|nr:twin-arginine translocase TatA/TatE family subunit [Terriglobia bacterium]